MKKVTTLLLALFVFTLANAQKVYFIYLQSENQEPFYARMGEKILNSASGGYLILSNLRDSTYQMNIGVAGGQMPEQLFSITVNKKDQGFLLKNFVDKGWGLFNLQTLSIINPLQANTGSLVKTEKRESNSFTDLLAKAADDSTLKERPVIEKVVEPIKEEPVVVKEKKDTVSLVNSIIDKKDSIPQKKVEMAKLTTDTSSKESDVIPGNSISKKETPIFIDSIPIKKDQEIELQDTFTVGNKILSTEEKPQEVLYKKSIVTKRTESSTSEGLRVTFFDINPGGQTDTIKLFIPNEKQKIVAPEKTNDDIRFLDIISTDTLKMKPKSNTDLDVGQLSKEVPEKSYQKTNDCLHEAGDDDFFKLRKKMASESTDDNMINEAKKAFKSKCYTTEQIKNLSTLFLTDEGKYKFFDLAYSNVLDLLNFKSLQSELTNEYFLNRFKAMVQ